MPQSKRSRRAGSGPIIFPRDWQDSRPRIDPKDLCIGCIVWLPPGSGYQIRVACDRENCCDEKLDDAGYDHPVVVVKIRQREGSYTPGDVVCSVACVRNSNSILFLTFLIFAEISSGHDFRRYFFLRLHREATTMAKHAVVHSNIGNRFRSS